MSTLEPNERDEIISTLRGLLVADLAAILKEEMKMFRPIMPRFDEGGPVVAVPGLGPIATKELRELEEERDAYREECDTYRKIARNVSQERDNLRAAIGVLSEQNLELGRELAIYKAGTGTDELKTALTALLEKLP